ncbi:NAD(P)/FAD-dependent oxidoreductase [Pseudoalteromonas sp. T1lg65]|uniref:NAD(P)/FAD-dependent oxidoreductase n=1 Tax=Pseudoalteromonas sp. T1lg65 TaxID=2077101 RepID=UPI003F79AE4F
MAKEIVDVLIIGAGPAGTMTAAKLIKSGLKVKIVERTHFPRYVIGESLLPQSMQHLEDAGFMDALVARNYQKKIGANFRQGQFQEFFDFSENYTEGWTWTWQVPRDDFDNVLAEEVQKMGVPIEFGSSVIDVNMEIEHPIVKVKNEAGESYEVEAQFVVDSSGYGRVLANLLDLNEPSASPTRGTLFAQFKPAAGVVTGEENNKVTILVHNKDVWIWLIPFSDGRVSVGFVGSPEYLESEAGDAKTRFLAYLGTNSDAMEMLEGMELCMEPKEIKGYSRGIKQLYGKNFVLTGNASEFIDPVFSAGVMFAIESGARAADLIVKQLNSESVDWQNDYEQHMVNGIEVMRTYIDGWYDGRLRSLFFAHSKPEKIKNQITSVLAGYVWDQTNPFVSRSEKTLNLLSEVHGNLEVV